MHILACSGHIWCNEATHNANWLVIPFTIATVVAIVALAALIQWFRS
jgi:hypothetical protein